MLVKGKWTDEWQPIQSSDEAGRFLRQRSSFRHRLGVGANDPFPVAANRYVLYIAYICPWASRALIALRLKGLETVIPVIAVDPRLSEQGWAFTGAMGTDLDAETQARHLHQLYTRADADFTGRATVPVLWDRHTHTIVNNESADILQILNRDFSPLARTTIDLRPPEREDDIEQWNQQLYTDFNNGVYQAGFASTQGAYDEAVDRVFATLDTLERHLQSREWIVGETLTETDIRAFVTLIRFDLAYYGLFKCNRQPLAAYPAVLRYLQRLLQIPAFAASVKPDHIKAGYYSIRALNPRGIVPDGPRLAYLTAAGH